METIIWLLIMIAISLLGIAVLLGRVIDHLAKKKANPKDMATPEYASELQAKFTPPPTRKTPNQIRAEYGFPPIVNDPWNAISRSPIGILHVSDNGMKMEEIRPSATAILMETLDLRKRVENTRMLYEHRPEFIGKNDLYDLMNRLDKELIERSSDLYSVNECSKRWKKLFETTETRFNLINKDCERLKKFYNASEEEVERLKTFETFANHVSSLPNCNNCDRKTCKFQPKCGEDVRFNCPIHVRRTYSPSASMADVGIIFTKEN